MTLEEAKEHADGMRPGHDIVDDGLAEAFRWALAEVADLRTRAIPADMLELVAIVSPVAATIGYVASDPDPATRWQCWSSMHRSRHPTLADALDAAGKVTP